jgi:hypothetical protein
MLIRKLNGEEIKKLTKDDYGTLGRIKESDLVIKSLPNACSSGHGWCEGGYCYVYCINTWYKLMDKNKSQYTCSNGGGKAYICDNSTYLATC